MNRSYTVNIKTKKGRVMKLVKELYLSSVMSCNSDICDSCVNEGNAGITLSSEPYNHQYLILDAEVLVNQMDVFQQEIPPLCDVIIVQSVLLEIRNRNLSVFNQISNLLRNKSRRFTLFANQNFDQTYLDRVLDESVETYNMRLLVKTVQYFVSHLKEYCITPILLTNNTKLQSSYKDSGISSLTILEYIESIKDKYTEISDHLNIVSIQDGCTETANESHDLIQTEIYDSVKKMYNLTKERGANTIFYNYLSDDVVKQGIESGRLYKGTYRSNQDNIREGRVNIHMKDQEASVLIQGREDINRSVDGDSVIIEIFPRKQWKAESDYLVTNDNEEDGNAMEKEEGSVSVIAEKKEIIESAVSGNLDKVITGRVVAIARRNWKTYCGSLEPIPVGSVNSYYIFDPVNRHIPKIRVKTSQYDKLINKRIVVAIDDWLTTSNYPAGHYVKLLGDIGDREVETQVLLLEHEIPPNVFSKEVLDCLPPSDWKISEENCVGREDLRGKVCILSIDPPGCKDIDDALHARDLPNGSIEVGIHIADVSYYIKHNNALDREARNRSTSTYLVDRRLDMLPKLLTENLCSLVEKQDRFAFSILIEMTQDGDVVSSRFVKSIIRSTQSMTYGQAQEYLDKADDKSEIGHSIHLLFKLSKKLKNRRIQAGALTLSSPEVRFQMDDERQDPMSMESYKMKDTNSLVEEFMLLGNCVVAKRIVEAFPKLAILRRHPTPDAKRFDNLVKVAKHAGFELICDSNKQLADSLDKAVIDDHPYFNQLLRILTTRCMTQAVYFPAGEVTPEQFYHYGLAAPIYTHFTSPIRRYADITVHRLLAAAEGIAPLPNEYKDRDFMLQTTDNMNFRHYNAQLAGRDSVELFTIIFFKGKEQQAPGVVMSCKKNGIKVWIPKFGIEGMIYINNTNKKNALNHNYNSDFEYDAETCVLTNSHNISDKIETFQPITVGIHVQEMKGFRREMILSLISSNAFDTKITEDIETKSVELSKKKSMKRNEKEMKKEGKKMKV